MLSDAVSRKTRTSALSSGGRRRWWWLISTVLQNLFLSLLSGGRFGAQGVADLVAGGDGGDFFPHFVFQAKKSSPAVVNDGDNLFGHAHLFLLAGSDIVLIRKVFQDLLKAFVPRVVRASPRLSAEDVGIRGLLDQGALVGDVVFFAVVLLGLLIVYDLSLFRSFFAFFVRGDPSRQFRCGGIRKLVALLGRAVHGECHSDVYIVGAHDLHLWMIVVE